MCWAFKGSHCLWFIARRTSLFVIITKIWLVINNKLFFKLEGGDIRINHILLQWVKEWWFKFYFDISFYTNSHMGGMGFLTWSIDDSMKILGCKVIENENIRLNEMLVMLESIEWPINLLCLLNWIYIYDTYVHDICVEFIYMTVYVHDICVRMTLKEGVNYYYHKN